MNLGLPRGLAAIALAWFAAAAHADVVITNLDQPVRSPTPLSSGFWYAQSFLTGAGDALRLDQVTVRAGTLRGTPAIVAELHADAGGAPGALLASFTLPGLDAGPLGDEPLVTTDVLTLAPSSVYWLLLGATGSGGYDWAYAQGNGASGSGSLGQYAETRDQGASWTGFGSENPLMMRVDVTPLTVPEPAVIGLLAAGLLMGLLRPRAAPRPGTLLRQPPNLAGPAPTPLRSLRSGVLAIQKKSRLTQRLRVLSRAVVLASSVLAVQGTASAATVTVTFNSFLGQHFFGSGNPVGTSEGFDFTSGPLQHFHFGDELPGSPGSTGVLLQDIDDNIISMTKNGGGAFDLLSIFAADELFSSGDSLNVMGFFSGGGSITTTFAISAAFQQFNFAGFSNLASVSFQSIGTDSLQTFWLDNLVLNDPPATNGVPAPPVWQLGVVGAFALGLSQFRRRRASQSVT